MADQDQGIFEPLFGSSAEQPCVDDAYIDAVEQGLDVEARFRSAKKQGEARKKMLLIERFLDELPETAAFVRGKVADMRNRVAKRLFRTLRTAEGITARFVGMALSEALSEAHRRERATRRLGGDPATIEDRTQQYVKALFGRARKIVAEEVAKDWQDEVTIVMDPVGDGSSIGFYGGVDPKAVTGSVVGSIVSQLKAGGYVS